MLTTIRTSYRTDWATTFKTRVGSSLALSARVRHRPGFCDRAIQNYDVGMESNEQSGLAAILANHPAGVLMVFAATFLAIGLAIGIAIGDESSDVVVSSSSTTQASEDETTTTLDDPSTITQEPPTTVAAEAESPDDSEPDEGETENADEAETTIEVLPPTTAAPELDLNQVGFVEWKNSICCSDVWELRTLQVSGAQVACLAHDYVSSSAVWADINLERNYSNLSLVVAIDEGADVNGDFSPSGASGAISFSSVEGDGERSIVPTQTVSLGSPLSLNSLDVSEVLRFRFNLDRNNSRGTYVIGLCEGQLDR